MAGNPASGTPRILGLTGPIACGKTTVGDILLRLGAIERIDADKIVHGLMLPGTSTTEAIRAEFGSEFLRSDGSVNRAHLGDLVFSDHESLRALEAITHPAVRMEIRRRLESILQREGVVVLDAVRLLQSELLAMCDATWVVVCVPEIQWRRLTEIRGLSPEAASARLSAQPSFVHPNVTMVIENSGSLAELEDTVAQAWDRFQQSNSA
jgi:dephospho-CoA kinase